MQDVGGPPSQYIRRSYLGFSKPLRLSWFVSVIGADYCLIYFWIAKDLSWMQAWLDYSIFFGLIALTWSLLVLFHAIRTLNWHELWNFIALFLWLFANYWWMVGEVHDYRFPDQKPISIKHSQTSSIILEFAVSWELIYYFIILPCNLLPCSKASLAVYDDGSLQSRFKCFRRFREYENLHTLFWIAKDLAWNRLQFHWWIVCMPATILLSIDYIMIAWSSSSEDWMVDVVHYTSIMIWVVGNSLWASGDFFYLTYGDTDATSREAMFFSKARWYSSWILFFALMLLVSMYGIWVSLTLLGKLEQPPPRSPRSPRTLSPGIRRGGPGLSGEEHTGMLQWYEDDEDLLPYTVTGNSTTTTSTGTTNTGTTFTGMAIPVSFLARTPVRGRDRGTTPYEEHYGSEHSSGEEVHPLLLPHTGIPTGTTTGTNTGNLYQQAPEPMSGWGMLSPSPSLTDLPTSLTNTTTTLSQKQQTNAFLSKAFFPFYPTNHLVLRTNSNNSTGNSTGNNGNGNNGNGNNTGTGSLSPEHTGSDSSVHGNGNGDTSHGGNTGNDGGNGTNGNGNTDMLIQQSNTVLEHHLLL